MTPARPDAEDKKTAFQYQNKNFLFLSSLLLDFGLGRKLKTKEESRDNTDRYAADGILRRTTSFGQPILFRSFLRLIRLRPACFPQEPDLEITRVVVTFASSSAPVK